MLRWLKRLIVSLAVVAIPVQGVAAATMLHCAEGHPGHALTSAAAEPVLPLEVGGPNPADQDRDHHPHDHRHAALPAASAAAVVQLGATTAVQADADAAPVLQLAHGHAVEPGAGGADTGGISGTTGTNGTGCSVCASCCVGSGITAAPLLLPSAPEARSAPRATDEATPPGATVIGLERPPRSNLA